jgi:hypothetical protein
MAAVPNLSELAQRTSQIRITLKPSHRASVLATVEIELETELGTIKIGDARILRNRSGVAWFSLPTYSVTRGREYEYLATVELSPTLHRRVSDAALAEFERWQREPDRLGGAR